MKNKKIIFVGGLFLFCGLILFSNMFFWKLVRIKRHFFWSELALTSEKQKKGLGKRDFLCRNCAMLFIFDERDRRAFWMKDMRFNLDILWIFQNKIVYIEKNFSSESDNIIKPPVVADKILEIRAGLSDEYGLEIGDEVKIYY